MSLKLKKQYIKNLKNQSNLLFKIRKTNYKSINSVFPLKKHYLHTNNNLITYIIDINFTKSNIFFHVMNFSGELKFFYSSGSFNYSGKNKKARYLVFRDIHRLLVSKLRFFKGKPIALHLKNVGYNRAWIIKKLKKKFFLKSVRNFNFYSHNGCRKRKKRRKKFKKK